MGVPPAPSPPQGGGEFGRSSPGREVPPGSRDAVRLTTRAEEGAAQACVTAFWGGQAPAGAPYGFSVRSGGGGGARTRGWTQQMREAGGRGVGVQGCRGCTRQALFTGRRTHAAGRAALTGDARRQLASPQLNTGAALFCRRLKNNIFVCLHVTVSPSPYCSAAQKTGEVKPLEPSVAALGLRVRGHWAEDQLPRKP